MTKVAVVVEREIFSGTVFCIESNAANPYRALTVVFTRIQAIPNTQSNFESSALL